MTSSRNQQSEPLLAGVIAWIHKYFLWLLVFSYVLAVTFPKPAGAIRALSFGNSVDSHVTAPMLLLATMLFCAASVVEWAQVRSLLQKPGIMLVSLLFVWGMPALFVSLLSGVLHSLPSTVSAEGLIVGLALVAAMPVANSSVAWTQDARGNVALGLGLIVLTIVLSPVAAPQMLQLMGLALSEGQAEHTEALVARFSGQFFIVWVILPSAIGLLFNRLVGHQRIQQRRGLIRLVSAAALLTLNYANASLLVTHEFDFFSTESLRVIFFAACLAIAISVWGLLSAAIAARWFSLEQASWVSLAFGFSMKHTGLALTLAGEVLEKEPQVILMIISATLLQHVVAGVVGRWLEHKKVQRKTTTQLDTD